VTFGLGLAIFDTTRESDTNTTRKKIGYEFYIIGFGSKSGQPNSDPVVLKKKKTKWKCGMPKYPNQTRFCPNTNIWMTCVRCEMLKHKNSIGVEHKDKSSLRFCARPCIPPFLQQSQALPKFQGHLTSSYSITPALLVYLTSVSTTSSSQPPRPPRTTPTKPHNSFSAKETTSPKNATFIASG
jgi:hypothetical protein